MSKKQQPSGKKQTPVSQEDNTQIQQQLEHYHQTAQALHKSAEPEQAEEILAPITSMSEAAQLAFAKALGKEHTVDAADVLLAINTFAPVKEVRKEARRSLIQLEATRTYPLWTPPAAPAPIIELTSSTTPARFWKGEYTDTRELGEVQLMLFWEQGTDYKEVRLMGFLLEFWSGGVKDFFTQVTSKRRAEETIAHMQTQADELTLVPCTLTKGRKLIEEALEVNRKRGTKPSPEYTRNLPLIQSLVLSAPEAFVETEEDLIEDEEDEEDEDSLDEFDAHDTIEAFLEAWAEQDYEEAYSYLASTSDLREDLSEEEWIDRREAWAEQADPEGLKYDVVFNLEEETFPDNVVSMHQEVEVFWSLEMKDTPLSATLKELPMGTAVYEETGRHWFWAKYRLVEEEDEWRIQSMIDEGADAQRLSRAELEQRMTTLFERIQALTEEINANADELDEDELDEDEDESDDLDIEGIEDELEEIVWVTKRALHYSDALIAQSPNNAEYYQRAVSQAITIPDWERAVIYLSAIAQRFPDQRSDSMSVLIIVLTSLAAEYEEEGLQERAEHFIDVIEKTLRDSVATDNNFMSNILLATMLISREEDLDEAESLLHQAQAMASEPKEQAQVENGLAKLADARGQIEVALTHYQRTVELDPEAPDIWFNIGSAQKELHQNDEAIQSFLRAIEADPESPEAYVELSRIYMEQGQLAKARQILDEGMDTIPDAADLYAARAMVYIMEGNLRDADDLLTEAEMIDPDLEIVQEARQLFNVRKAQRQSFKPKSGKHKPKKR